MYKGAFEKLIPALSRGAAVLTANARLTRHLISEYDFEMRLSGATAWPTPRVMPWTSWLLDLWEEYGREPVLGGLRERMLWERIVKADGPGGPAASGIAKPSFEAYRLIHEYSIELPEDIYLTEEARALRRWQGAFESEMKRLGYIPEAVVAGEVKRLIARGVPVAKEVILAGFDELSPVVSALTGALKARSVAVSFWPGPIDKGQNPNVMTAPCKDEEDEIIRAARWTRSVYSPGKRIGIIVPGLERYRAAIKREFTAELDPASVLPGSERRPVFNMSLGEPLIEEPLVKSAMDVLSIGEGREKTSLLRRALLSPYMAGVDFEAFAALDFTLRDENKLEAGLFEIRSALSGSASRRVGEWLDRLREERKKKAPSAWAKAFAALLSRVGWLNGGKLSSGEYQALSAWNKALEGFAGLDDIAGSITRKEAVDKLSSIVSETIHQIETPDADIQVLGALEASGMWFDHARVLGCHEGAWPPEPSPNPFIPLFIQRAKRLPHSTSERELEFAKAVSARLLWSAPSVIVSWPLVSEDRERKVSPLFSAFPQLEAEAFHSARALDMPLCTLEDGPAEEVLPVGEAEKAELRGGTSILKNQSICPFRAFALHRLHARPLPETSLDLKPETRGSIVHHAMRLFWEDVRDSRRLQELHSSGGLQSYVESIASRALQDAEVPYPLSRRFVELEKKRLTALLMDWAEVELKRETGFTVKTVELERELVIGGLALKGRVDRIDELEGGGELILDYKTGRPDLKDWLSERPMDPQLLIYCAGSKFDAVSFARVAPGECKFVGICKDDVLPGIRPYGRDRFSEKTGGLGWEALMDFWKNAVEGLARDFLAGINDVDPNNGPSGGRACEYCELVVLCRFSGHGPREKGEDDDIE